MTSHAEEERKEPPRRRWVAALGVIAIVAVAGGLWSRQRSKAEGAGPSGSARPTGSADRVISVVAATVLVEDVPLIVEGLGNAIPLQTVTLKAQIDGRLEKVFFREGQDVKKGDLLAQIDARPISIQLKQGEATLARDQALLHNNKLNLDRFVALREQNLASQQQVDDQRALVSQNEASIQLDRAQMDASRLQLEYSRVVSPIDGVTGVRQVDPGNLVHASDQTGIVVITQLDPIALVFSLPQDDLPRLSKQLAEGPVEVEAFSRDGNASLGKGQLTVVDNQINTATASLKLKATIPNSARQLWPNQFVKARVKLSVRKGAKVIPAAVVQRGTRGSFVYVIGDDQRVSPRDVVVESIQGDRALIASGLEAGEQVVVEGQHLLRPGARVSTRPTGSGQPSMGAPGARP